VRGQRHVAGPRTGNEWSNLIERSIVMLWTLAVILVILWLLGLITSYTAGGLIHLLLVVALFVIVIQLIQGRRPLS
jgi:hypothetical protein